MNYMHERSIDVALDRLLDAIGLERLLDLLDGRYFWSGRCATPIDRTASPTSLFNKGRRR